MERLAAFSPAVRTLDESIARAQIAERLGYDSVWLAQLPDARDVPLVLASYAAGTERIKLATGVLPIYTRHPTAMVQMAATLDELSGGRFILGLGISHKITVETMWGQQITAPVETMREYLTIVRSSLDDGVCAVEGKHFTARWAYSGPRRRGLQVMIAALAPRMLGLAGEMADGVVLGMCSPRYIREVAIPALTAGREKAGRSMDGFEVVAVVSVSVTSNRTAGLDVYRRTVSAYSNLPYYRRVLDAAGFKDQLDTGEISDAMLDELAGIGDERRVRDAIDRYRRAGVTLPCVSVVGRHEGSAGFEATLEAAASA